MVFGDTSPELAEKLKAEFLPQGMPADLEETELVGVSFSAPKADPSGSRASGAAGDLGEGPGGAAWWRGVGVRERRVLSRYFGEE
ncbi:MAG: hypothetical protein HY720_30540 [Planctomycetes bacterium]|nr:hypothetical protein [Planctomycetota bacterium]